MGKDTDKNRASELLRQHLGPMYDLPINEDVNGQLLAAMLEFGREKKINGAKSFAKLVKEMRSAQNRYFEHRTEENLYKAKKLELRVDQACIAVMEGL